MCPRCKSRLWNVPRQRPVALGNGLGFEEILQPHREELLRVAHHHGAAALWVFGSVARRGAGPDSDVDIMVRWSRRVSLLDKALLNVELERLLRRKVDLVNEGSLHWAIEPKVEAERVPI